jgi:hypothetical protein
MAFGLGPEQARVVRAGFATRSTVKKKARTDYRREGTAADFARSFIQQSGGSCAREQLRAAMLKDPTMASRLHDPKSFARLVFNLKESGRVDVDGEMLRLATGCPQMGEALPSPSPSQPRLRPDLNLAQLQAFYSAARNRTLAEAAAQCGTTRQSLCMTLKKLEASVGAPLFVRAVRGTGSELTPSGQELIALYEELSTVIARIQRAFPGLINGLSEG